MPALAEQALEKDAPLEPEAELARDAVEAAGGAHAATVEERWGEPRARGAGAPFESSVHTEAVEASPEHEGQPVAIEDSGRALEAEGGEIAAGPAAVGAPAEQPGEPARISREDALVAVLTAPIAGSVAAAYQQKEAAIRGELERLPAAECRVLAERLRRARPGDQLAALFGRMTVERRGRLLAYLDDARRREAVRAARAPRALQTELAG